MKLKAFRAIFKLLLTVLSCGLSLLIVDKVLTVTGYEPKRIWYKWVSKDKFYRQDSKRIWALKDGSPDSLDLNDKHGFRMNRLQGFNSEDKRKKVFLVGDSFIFGGYVRDIETVAYYFQERLNYDDYNVTIVNAGVPGYGAGQTYIYLTEELIPKYQPDVVIWSLSVNDLWDDSKRSMHLLINDRLIRFPVWTNGIYLQGLIKEKIERAYYESRVVNLLVYALQEFDLVSLLEPDDKQLRIKKTKLMIENVKKSGIPLLVIIAPSQEVISFLEQPDFYQESLDDDYLFLTKLSSELTDYYDANYGLIAMNKLFLTADILEQTNVLGARFLSDLFFLDERLEQGSVFGYRHLSALGNKAYAELLYEYLSRMNL